MRKLIIVRKIKSILAVLIIASICMACCFTVGFADDDNPVIYVDRVLCSENSTISVNVSIKNNPGIVSMALRLSYDKDSLELTQIVNGSVLSGAVHSNELDLFGGVLSWNQAGSHSNNTKNGIIVTLKFNVKNDCAEGKQDISISYANSAASIYNVDLQPVTFEIHNGYAFVIKNEGYYAFQTTYDDFGKMIGISKLEGSFSPVVLTSESDTFSYKSVYLVDSTYHPIEP